MSVSAFFAVPILHPLQPVFVLLKEFSTAPLCLYTQTVAYRGILFGGGGAVQQIQLTTEDRENGNLGDGSPLVRGSGGSCNLVQEISFHIVKFS